MANRTNSPLLGYNTNVKHEGHTFHIQTEDSGRDHPHVITHLFTSGTILSTKKRSYKEVVEEPDWEDRVRQMMKDQHKLMFVELREGVHDGIAARILGVPIGKANPADQPAAANELEIAERISRVSDVPLPPAPRDGDPSNVRVIAPAAMRGRSSIPAPGAAPAAAAPAGRSIFEAPDAGGSFGEALISDKSLDEVILTYLKDELDE